MSTHKKPDPLSGKPMSRGAFLRSGARWIVGGALVLGGAVLGFRKPGDERVDCPPGGVCRSCGRRAQCDRKPEAPSPKLPTKNPK